MISKFISLNNINNNLPHALRFAGNNFHRQLIAIVHNKVKNNPFSNIMRQIMKINAFHKPKPKLFFHLECLSATDWEAHASGLILQSKPEAFAYPVTISEIFDVPLPTFAGETSK